MNEQHAAGGSLGLRVFDGVLRVVMVLLVAATVLALPLAALFVTGRGPIAIPVHVDPPYSVGFSGDRAIEVGGPNRITAYINFPVGEEFDHFGDAPVISATVKVGADDMDTRLVLSGVGAGLLALAWGGVINLRRLVASARSGDPFDPSNVARLRMVGVCIGTVPMMLWLTTLLLDRTLDVDPSVTPVSDPRVWLVVLALGLVALAEVFREGTVLRRLERETV
jgi:hypothetical protein